MAGFLKGSFTTALTLAFLWLCWYAWHEYQPQPRTAFNQFVDRQEAAYHPKDTGVAHQPKTEYELPIACETDAPCFYLAAKREQRPSKFNTRYDTDAAWRRK